MKLFLSFLLLLSFLACQQRDSKTVTVSPNDSTQAPTVPVPKNDAANSGSNKEAPLSIKDSALLKLAEEVLVAIKNKDYKKLSTYVHPRLGVFLSAYAYVNTKDSTRLTATELANPKTFSRIVNWGAFEPADSSAGITIDAYFNKFVYDKDFLHAEKKSVNSFHNTGTDTNNIIEAFPEAEFVEFYFPGFDPKYEGLDFRGLRLAFKTENDKTYLIGIVHHQWTP
jgi:hypothetical protein